MKTKRKDTRTLDEVLQSTSDTMFPADLGKRKVKPRSRAVDGDTPLHVMAWRNDVHGAELLIAAGVDVNAVGDMSETPLHVAVRNANRRLIEALLKAGAKVHLRSEFGATPAEMAATAGGEIASLFNKAPNNRLQRSGGK